MKLIIFFIGFSIVSCRDSAQQDYEILLPPVPQVWRELLGEPEWYIEWINPEGSLESTTVRSIRVGSEWTTPIFAYPYWSAHGIEPKIFKPAGGLFPFDYTDKSIRLSWRGGVDAVFYQEILRYAGSEKNKTKVPRISPYFNWIKFREILNEETIKKTVGNDLWNVDWSAVARRTVESGFDKRSIVARETHNLHIPIEYTGTWISTSAFAEPIYQEGEYLIVNIPASPTIFVSENAILRCSLAAWILMPIP
ncbi:MAG: hypothetical protein LBQ77_06125 [Treponema sp.]|jgi:hypothetical protein|nr:hypothetical protein [Treponema sp.]